MATPKNMDVYFETVEDVEDNGIIRMLGILNGKLTETGTLEKIMGLL